MVSSTVATADLTALATRLRKAHQGVAEASEQLLDETATSVYELMLQLAPVDTGRLKASIRIVAAPGIRTIGPQGVDYATFQEFGTGIRGEFPTKTYIIRPRDENGTLTFQIDGRWVSTKEVRHPGIPPNPFVRPAAHQSLDSLEQRYEQMGAGLITGRKIA